MIDPALLQAVNVEWLQSRASAARHALALFRRIERNTVCLGRALLFLNVVLGVRALALMLDPGRPFAPWLFSFATHAGLFVYVFRRFENRWAQSCKEARAYENEIASVEREITELKKGMT